MSTRSKRSLAFGLVVAAALLLPLASRPFRWLQLAELKGYDFQVQTLPPSVPEEILLVTIDQASIERYPEPLFLWHHYYARAIEAASRLGARVVGVDIAFGIPVDRWAPGYDALLAQAFLQAQSRSRLVCGTAAPLATMQRQWPVPWNMLCAANGAGAFVNLRSDQDDFIRSFEVTDATGGHSGFAWAAARAYNPRLAAPPGRLVRIRHAGPAGTVRRISLSAFLDGLERDQGEALRPQFAGKIVLLGPDLITDRHATPYYSFRAGWPANTSGVEIHASSIATLLSGRYLLDLSETAILLVALAIAAALAAAAVLASARVFAWVALLAPFLIAFAANGMLRAGHVAPTVLWLLVWLTALLSGLLARSLLAERRGALFRQAAGVFIGERPAGRIEEAGTLRLAPRQQQVTALFTDIEGFTAFSESRQPAEVLECLNQYFETVTAIVVRHGGQVNKLIGDGMLALFSAEDDATEPPEVRAVRAGAEIVSAGTGFRTRAGVHTGLAVVGNVGSGAKLEYTALGDTLNVASRLEAENKQWDTRILVSGATRAAIGDSIALRLVGEVGVRGKTTGLPIYTIGW